MPSMDPLAFLVVVASILPASTAVGARTMTMDVWTVHSGPGWYLDISGMNAADVVGEYDFAAFLCSNCGGRQFGHFTVEYDQLGSYEMCNGGCCGLSVCNDKNEAGFCKPGGCTPDSNGGVVGSEASIGGGGGGIWYSLPFEGKCRPGQQVGVNCHWRVTKLIKLVEGSCVEGAKGLVTTAGGLAAFKVALDACPDVQPLPCTALTPDGGPNDFLCQEWAAICPSPIPGFAPDACLTTCGSGTLSTRLQCSSTCCPHTPAGESGYGPPAPAPPLPPGPAPAPAPAPGPSAGCRAAGYQPNFDSACQTSHVSCDMSLTGCCTDPHGPAGMAVPCAAECCSLNSQESPVTLKSYLLQEDDLERDESDIAATA